MKNIPAYLAGCEAAFARNPREANRAWFAKRRYGLFIHYGLYALLGGADMQDVLRAIGANSKADAERGGREWAQYHALVPVAVYERLAERFTAERFDADAIVSFARACGMEYITLTTRHHDSFCLWDTVETAFNSVASAAKRDLVRELYQACEKQEMALFLYYSHGRDWRHPHAPNNDPWGGKARPLYEPPEPTYRTGSAHDLNQYTAFVQRQILELLRLFPHVAGIWLDGIGVPLSGAFERFHVAELYDAIRRESPHALISYTQGLLGTEDFFAPEHSVPKHLSESGKLVEVCTTMIEQPGSWGYIEGARHRSKDEVARLLTDARAQDNRLLLNIGLRGDGSIDPLDRDTLLSVSASPLDKA